MGPNWRGIDQWYSSILLRWLMMWRHPNGQQNEHTIHAIHWINASWLLHWLMTWQHIIGPKNACRLHAIHQITAFLIFSIQLELAIQHNLKHPNCVHLMAIVYLMSINRELPLKLIALNRNLSFTFRNSLSILCFLCILI